MIRHSVISIISTLTLSTAVFAAEPVPVTAPGSDYIGPIWSPAGTQIAVSQSGYQGVWLINAQSQKMTKLSDANAAGFGMAWSHDGQFLATTENQPETTPRRTAIRIYDTKNNTGKYLSGFETRLTGTLCWSPDDQAVFLVGHSPVSAAFFSLTGNQRVEGYDFFSILRDQILTYNSASQVVTPRAGNARYLNLQPSPDGNAYVCEKLGGGLQIGNASGVIAELEKGERPRWSPDGQFIVFQIAKDDGERILESDLWQVNSDGRQMTQLTSTPDQIELNPSLAPNNQTIVYQELNSRRIYTLKLER